MISTPIVTPAAALASQDRGSATGQGVRRMLVRLRNEVARETPRGGSPTSFQGSIGAWPTMSSRSVACIVCALMPWSCALAASSSSGVEASAWLCGGDGGRAAGAFCRKLPIARRGRARFEWLVLASATCGLCCAGGSRAFCSAAAPTGCL